MISSDTNALRTYLAEEVMTLAKLLISVALSPSLPGAIDVCSEGGHKHNTAHTSWEVSGERRPRALGGA